MKTTVIFHNADFDGIFCREIARKFLPDAELIGWNHGDALISFPDDGPVYVLDLSPDVFDKETLIDNTRLIWIDHHKSSIQKWSAQIRGYRIDGVAACRLAWQWFSRGYHNQTSDPDPLYPKKDFYVDRKVPEPLAVRLAGEYDIWDKRDPDAELFQHGLRSMELTDSAWGGLLSSDEGAQTAWVGKLLLNGVALQYARTHENASIIKEIGFDLEWEGLRFLACNAARYNSHLFTAGLKPEHDACFGFKWTGKTWSVSLYHAPGKEHHDLSIIAVKYSGGGHRGACGFQTDKLPFLK